MSERAEILRQRAREEAAHLALSTIAAQSKGSFRKPVPIQGHDREVAPVIAGETTCFRCGTRSSIGCRHSRKAYDA